MRWTHAEAKNPIDACTPLGYDLEVTRKEIWSFQRRCNDFMVVVRSVGER